MLRPAVLICAVLAVAVVGSAIAVVVARHESRRSFAELERLVVERDELNIEWGRSGRNTISPISPGANNRSSSSTRPGAMTGRGRCAPGSPPPHRSTA